MAGELAVWLFGQPVGTLAQIDGRLGFSYAPGWLARADSVALPRLCMSRARMILDCSAA